MFSLDCYNDVIVSLSDVPGRPPVRKQDDNHLDTTGYHPGIQPVPNPTLTGDGQVKKEDILPQLSTSQSQPKRVKELKTKGRSAGDKEKGKCIHDKVRHMAKE